MSLESEIHSNYHSWLGDIKPAIDPILRHLRQQDTNGWRKLAWSGPLKEFIGHLKSLKFLSAIKWASIPVLGSFVPSLVIFYTQWPKWCIGIAAPLLMLLVYFIYVKRYEAKMVTMGSPQFHAGAFKAKRAKEYELWQHLFKHSNCNFSGLYDIFTEMLHQTKDDHAVTSLIAYSQGREGRMEKEIEELKGMIQGLEETSEDIIEDLDRSTDAISYLVSVIKSVNLCLYRMANQCFTIHDLDFIDGFTLYEKDGDKLRKIADKGTSGGSPDEIMILSEHAQRYAAVHAAKSDFMEPCFNSPYPGRIIVSFRMKMSNQVEWIWNFHFDERDKRSLSLILENDIIESMEIYRLIHVFCLFVQRQMVDEKGGVLDASSKLSNES
ncbi:hypothetical protein SAMN04487897_10982 [Paenibacillus sp. yr247]|uniref:hypothetical protein n=1 Tax=Paenibacillus sp. yr247 TaxID=1761880 RepID=UPI00088C8F1C|nr:hypothetical protein [Paenibacillus sp. yr247]SDO16894.1 hypothetical protein SAMN04487897_10982 [Paenibacillus sp. yr247]